MINFAGKGVKWGSGRPDRHPAWSRIPLLWALYTGATGVDLSQVRETIAQRPVYHRGLGCEPYGC